MFTTLFFLVLLALDLAAVFYAIGYAFGCTSRNARRAVPPTT